MALMGARSLLKIIITPERNVVVEDVADAIEKRRWPSVQKYE